MEHLHFDYLVMDCATVIKRYATFKRACRAAERMNQEYGAVRFRVVVVRVNFEEKTVDNLSKVR